MCLEKSGFFQCVLVIQGGIVRGILDFVFFFIVNQLFSFVDFFFKRGSNLFFDFFSFVLFGCRSLLCFYGIWGSFLIGFYILYDGQGDFLNMEIQLRCNYQLCFIICLKFFNSFLQILGLSLNLLVWCLRFFINFQVVFFFYLKLVQFLFFI